MTLSHDTRSLFLFMTVVMPVAAILLAACTGSHHARMQQELAALQAMNQADSLLTNDSLAQTLADWFDDHGTPNEQMEAHYLLGRTHADRGEAPAALAAYHDAIDRADTTSTDCKFSQLCRVYAQMANVFYQQSLMSDFLDYLDRAIACSEKAGDTLTATNMMAHKMAAYERMDMPDSVIMIYEDVSRRLCDMGYRNDAAAYSFLAIGSYIKKGQTDKAKDCIRFYENESGFFMDDGNIMNGREVYYNLRGRYHMAVHEYDSALYFFRKELSSGKDFNNQNGASRGLALLYRQIGVYDSAAIYALYSYAMNDSVYAQMATEEVERMHQLYNYTRHQKVAHTEKLRAEQEENKAEILSYTIVFICIAVLLVLRYYHLRKKEARRQFEEAKEELEKVSSELQTLKRQNERLIQLKETTEANAESEEKWMRHEAELRILIESKEKETERLKAKIAAMKAKLVIHTRKSSSNTNRETEVYHFVQEIADRMEKMKEEEWENLSHLVSKEKPELYRFLCDNKQVIGIPGYHICLLLSQPLRVKDVANMMGSKSSYISRISSDVLDKLWRLHGSSKELQAKLSEI